MGESEIDETQPSLEGNLIIKELNFSETSSCVIMMRKNIEVFSIYLNHCENYSFQAGKTETFTSTTLTDAP